MKKAVRTNKIFVDWSQNDEHKTTISVYSLRAREHPTVSTPVTWDEVEQALKKKDAERFVFEAKDVLARVEKMGDLFAPVQTLKQKLPQLAGLAAEVEKEADQETGRGASGAGHPLRRCVQRRRRRRKGSPPRRNTAKYSFALRGRNMAQLYVGTSGWAYPTWKPAFYRKNSRKKSF